MPCQETGEKHSLRRFLLRGARSPAREPNTVEPGGMAAGGPSVERNARCPTVANGSVGAREEEPVSRCLIFEEDRDAGEKIVGVGLE
jgi:hypothetical protein